MDAVNPMNILTAGGYAEESAALAAFDAIIQRSEAFGLHKEICGDYIQPRFDTEQKRARIDRILIPKSKVVDAGWLDGPIGVEAKRSDTKAGKIVCQALDYSRCIWRLPSGFSIVIRWVFIWPLDSQLGDLQSIMANNRIGYARPSRSGAVFGCGGTTGIEIFGDGSVTAKQLPMGRRVGSR